MHNLSESGVFLLLMLLIAVVTLGECASQAGAH